MTPIYTLLIAMIVLFIGINLAANNTLHSYIVGYIFYNDKMSHRVLSFIGISMLVSVVLFITHMTLYAVFINILCMIIFIYLSIRGRSKAQSIKKSKREQTQQAYNAEIQRKKMEIAEIRKNKKQELEGGKGKSKSLKDMKKEAWNDGSLSNQDMINKLKG